MELQRQLEQSLKDQPATETKRKKKNKCELL